MNPAATLYPAPARRRLPEDFRPAGWAEIEPVLAELEQRALPDAAALEAWLLDRSEADALISAEASRRHVAAARHTDDEAAQAAHLEYQTEVLPEVKKVEDRLDRKYLACRHRAGLDPARWQVFDREVELAVRLFREENLPLESEEERLSTEYGQITGAMTVEYRGKTWTMPALGKFSENPDRGVREEVWRLAAARRLEDRARLTELFEQMLALRARMAANAGFADYRDYKHESYARFDYTPQDCLALHENVERAVLPLVRKMDADRQARMGLERLRPWDMAADPDGKPAFEPFQDEAGQVEVAAGLLGRIDPRFAADLRWMQGQELLDLATRPGKRQGGFMDTFEDRRIPFIFANSGTTHRDVETLVHEGGHAVHALRSRDIELLAYRQAPLEFAEVASMGMECMAMEHFGEVYPQEEARRAAVDSLEGIARGLPWIAVVDAFQHWLYTHAGHAAAERQAQWVALRARFGGAADWSGLEDFRAYDWQRQLHLYEVPFYYVEYALAQIGALQVWRNYRRDRAGAVRQFEQGMALGGSQPLPALYAAAGIRFDPRGELLGELMAEVEAAWEALRPQGR